jgi:hypothetical protein
MIDTVPFGSKELEGNTIDELAQHVAQDYQFCVATQSRLTKAIFEPQQQQRLSALKVSVRIEFLDSATDDQKAALEKRVTDKVQQGPYPGLRPRS